MPGARIFICLSAYIPFKKKKKKETRKMMTQSYCLSVCGWVCRMNIPIFELTEFHVTYAVTTELPTVALSNFL